MQPQEEVKRAWAEAMIKEGWRKGSDGERGMGWVRERSEGRGRRKPGEGARRHDEGTAEAGEQRRKGTSAFRHMVLRACHTHLRYYVNRLLLGSRGPVRSTCCLYSCCCCCWLLPGPHCLVCHSISITSSTQLPPALAEYNYFLGTDPLFSMVRLLNVFWAGCCIAGAT